MKSETPITNQYWNKFKRTGAVVSFLLLIVGIIGIRVETARAGLFSFLIQASSDQASAETTQAGGTPTSATMDILHPSGANVNPNPDIACDQTYIDDGETLVANSTPNASASCHVFSTQISTYVVKKGDTLSGIAQLFNVSVNTILWANNITGRTIQPGQTLVILPISGITYKVKSGDTLQSLAKKYRTGADSDEVVKEIMAYNNLTSTSVSVGDTLIIPDAELSAPPVVAVKHGIKVAPNEPLLDGWNYPNYPGYYACPLVGRLTQGLHGHNAIDLGAPRGSAIHAAAAGTVIISMSNGAWNGGYGNFVVLLHQNGTQTLYAHMSSPSVTVGQQVAQGQTIGHVGMTGMTTGPHLHFEIRGGQNPFVSQSCI
jgi:murein DD-endopeptidase MepM/ murein hydrolase activator NlpD